MKTYKNICNNLLFAIECNKKELRNILISIETLKMADDEIERTVYLLKNIHVQNDFLNKSYDDTMSSFLPLNQPFYSLVLQVVVPSFVLKKIFYRPPSSQTKLHESLYGFFSKICANIELCSVSRRQFLNEYISQSKIVNFTGQYDNAIDMISHISRDVTVIYNGSAINPVIIDEDADLKLAANDLVLARLYNSGQDCMAPTCVFVNRNCLNSFLEFIQDKLSSIKIGRNEDPRVDVGPLISQEAVCEFLEFKKKYRDYLIYGGYVNNNVRLVEPTIFCFNTIRMDIKKIYFAPYFIIMTYSNIREVKEYLNSDYCERFAGYISLYGKRILNSEWYSGTKKLIPLNNATLYTIEDGNKEFGGYGLGCNFIYSKGKFRSAPMLLLREIKNILEE